MGFTIPNKQNETYPDASRVWASDLSIITNYNLNWIIRDTNTCAVTPPGGGGRNVDVAAGTAYFAGTGRVTISGTTKSLTAAHSTLPRIDLIEVGSNAVIDVTNGTAAATPIPPVPSAGHISLAYVYSGPGDTGNIVAGDIVDKRVVKANGANWTSYTPVLTATTTNPTLGSGSSQVGAYTAIGKIIVGYGTITFGTSGVNAGSGEYQVTFPKDCPEFFSSALGISYINDSSLSDIYVASFFQSIGDNANQARLRLREGESGQFVSDKTPFTWNTNDQIRFVFEYEAA